MITFLIKTFLRDEYLKECVKSIQKHYKDAPIIIADGGFSSPEKEKYYNSLRKKGVRIWHLPFDCGICYGRNFLVGQVKTPYVLIGDDDFFFEKTTNVQALKTVLDAGKADIVGGLIRERDKVRNYQGHIEQGEGYLVYTALGEDYKTTKGVWYAMCDITFNFALMKKQVFKKALWDNNIKVAYEHSDFFLTAKNAGFKTAFTPDACVIHKPEHVTPKNKHYRKYRMRKSDKDYFFNKWELEWTQDMQGNKTTR